MIKTFFEIEDAVKEGYEPNALDNFVIANEPAGKKEEKKFHMELKALVEYVQIETRKE